MTYLITLSFNVIAILGLVSVVSFLLGLLYKKAYVYKQKKRILRLEDEMLDNHSTILGLEKKLAELQKGKDNPSNYNITTGQLPDQGLKVS